MDIDVGYPWISTDNLDIFRNFSAGIDIFSSQTSTSTVDLLSQWDKMLRCFLLVDAFAEALGDSSVESPVYTVFNPMNHRKIPICTTIEIASSIKSLHN